MEQDTLVVHVLYVFGCLVLDICGVPSIFFIQYVSIYIYAYIYIDKCISLDGERLQFEHQVWKVFII